MKVSHPERSSGLDVHGHDHGDGSWKYPEASAFSKVDAGCVSVPGRMMSELESEGGGVIRITLGQDLAAVARPR